MITSQAIRKIILQQSKRAHVGHIGSGLCVAEILAVLYRDILRIADPHDAQRDRFVLSKGHAALALYATLHLKGWLSFEELNSFCGNGTYVGVHPEHKLQGVDFCTGSLGQGLSMAVGSALAARMQKSSRKVYALLSDAECNEGAVWEAAMFAAHHKLNNLVVVVDVNAQQALGYTKDVLNIGPLEKLFSSFNWSAEEVDGHDEKELARALCAPSQTSQPRIVLAKTVFGKGVSYMENQIKWHYWPMSDEEYKTAIAEVEAQA